MPSYVQGAPDRWQQAVALFEFVPSGGLSYSLIRIDQHRFVYNCRVYGG